MGSGERQEAGNQGGETNAVAPNLTRYILRILYAAAGGFTQQGKWQTVSRMHGRNSADIYRKQIIERRRAAAMRHLKHCLKKCERFYGPGGVPSLGTCTTQHSIALQSWWEGSLSAALDQPQAQQGSSDVIRLLAQQPAHRYLGVSGVENATRRLRRAAQEPLLP